MKFLVTKELAHVALLKNLMVTVCVALFFYLGLDVVVHGYVLGFDVDGILSSLYGNAEEYIEPILIDSLLLQVHIDLFMSLFSLLILSSIYIRLFAELKSSKYLVHVVLFLGLLSPLLLMLAYFTSEVWVFVWLFSFILGHLLAMYMSLTIVKKLLIK